MSCNTITISMTAMKLLTKCFGFKFQVFLIGSKLQWHFYVGVGDGIIGNGAMLKDFK